MLMSSATPRGTQTSKGMLESITPTSVRKREETQTVVSSSQNTKLKSISIETQTFKISLESLESSPNRKPLRTTLTTDSSMKRTSHTRIGINLGTVVRSTQQTLATPSLVVARVDFGWDQLKIHKPVIGSKT